MRHKMKCSEVQLRLSAFQDNELSEALMDNIKRHVEACPACAHQLELLDAVTATVRSLPQDEPLANFTALVMGRIRESEKTRQFKFMPSLVYSLVVILCFGLGILLNSPTQASFDSSNSLRVANNSITQLMDQSQTLSLSQVQESSLEILLAGKGRQR